MEFRIRPVALERDLETIAAPANALFRENSSQSDVHRAIENLPVGGPRETRAAAD